MTIEQTIEVSKFLWHMKDPNQQEDETLFVSDIERLMYLTGVKFDHQSRNRILEAEVTKLHNQGV
jgi:hypothetical protein